MSKYYCGRCGKEFVPEPYFYGGSNLCSSCRGKISDNILKAKEAYDRMSPEDRRRIDFASAIENALPSRREERTCNGCGTHISSGIYCSSCKSRIERERREWEIKQKRAREEFERRLKNI